MKIIDLAEKQRNNEILPKHIIFENEDLYFDGVTYYDEEGNNDLFDILAINNNALTHLYDEIEVIEEKKIPEELPTWFSLEKDCENDNIQYANYNFERMYGKINEICDYLKSKGDE